MSSCGCRRGPEWSPEQVIRSEKRPHRMNAVRPDVGGHLRFDAEHAAVVGQSVRIRMLWSRESFEHDRCSSRSSIHCTGRPASARATGSGCPLDRHDP